MLSLEAIYYLQSFKTVRQKLISSCSYSWLKVRKEIRTFLKP